jgi:hypothetical protein
MRKIRMLGLLALIGLMPLGTYARGATSNAEKEMGWSGKVTAVSPDNHTFTATSWWHTRTFDVGEKCAISTLDKKAAALSDLRIGDRVKVCYREAGGALVAEQIRVKALHLTGTVQSVDRKARTVTLEEPFSNHSFRLADDCKVVLWNGKEGAFIDLTPGNKVRVAYELPNGSPVAYRIRQETQTFVGKVSGIDSTYRTVEASELLEHKQFRVPDNCPIMVNGKPTENLRNLQLGHTYLFSYENVDGVNVAERIAPASPS